jgi:hypothetical protein
MKSLRVFFIQNNNLTRLPPEIGALAAIFPPLSSIESREHIKRGGPELQFVGVAIYIYIYIHTHIYIYIYI